MIFIFFGKYPATEILFVFQYVVLKNRKPNYYLAVGHLYVLIL
jgi:hypothetical protein